MPVAYLPGFWFSVVSTDLMRPHSELQTALFPFPRVHIGFVETIEKSGEHPYIPFPWNALRIFTLLQDQFHLTCKG